MSFQRILKLHSCHAARLLLTCGAKKNIEFPTVYSIVDHSSPMFLIRDNLIKLFQNKNLSIEEALFEGFYILLELYKNQPVTISQINEYFFKADSF